MKFACILSQKLKQMLHFFFPYKGIVFQKIMSKMNLHPILEITIWEESHHQGTINYNSGSNAFISKKIKNAS